MIKSFRNKLFLIMVGLVLAIEAITMFAALRALEQDALTSSSRNLQVGERVFRQLLRTREEQLATGVRVLADDFGFKEAIAIGDRATLESALANHGNRIDADLVAFVTPAGDIAASTHRFASAIPGTDRFPVTEMLVTSRAKRTSARTLVLPDGVFQMVVAPVFAPQLIGWVSVGFSVNDELAGALKELTNLDVTFLSTAKDSSSRLPASTLPDSHRRLLPSIFWSRANLLQTEPGVFNIDGAAYLSLAIDLGAGAQPVFALLQRSLNDALAGYRRLLEQLSIIFLGTLVLAIVAARVVAGGVTQPVRLLADAARRIASGRYDTQVDVTRTDELGLLANTFNEMQTGIAARERQILHQSRHDALTDLPNRLALQERLALALGRTQRSERGGALLLLDIRGFKAVNDNFGHDTGDDALKKIAASLTAEARTTDTVARYGGNCFVVLVDEAGPAEARALADRVLQAFAEPVALPRTQVRLDLTVGAAIFPQHGDATEMLLRRAEIAMYNARQRNEKFAFYEVGQDESHLRRLELINKLTHALDQDLLQVFYQPKLDLTTGRVEQAEALVRWRDEEFGPVSPAEFVPIAEQSGLMRQLTTAVLRKVVTQMRDWSKQGVNIVVSANISTIDLGDTAFPDRLRELMLRLGVAPQSLRLEITESALMSDPDSAADVLNRLQAGGFHLAIDDFGTGYSSLVQLKQMPVTELKIDKSFVLGLPDNEDDAVIVRSTIELAHNLGMSVVAEGTEDIRSINFLRAEGCDIAQGFGIARPMPAAEFFSWLKQHHSAGGVATQAQVATHIGLGGKLVLQN